MILPGETKISGALVLNPVLKSLIGRLRPALAHPIAHGTGSSFPSGHALGSMVCYGALLLVFLPAVRGRGRTALRVVVAAIILIVGVSRMLLGVHYVSDVVGGWAIGQLWLFILAPLIGAAVASMLYGAIYAAEPATNSEVAGLASERLHSGA